jgi:hypothetical protein
MVSLAVEGRRRAARTAAPREKKATQHTPTVAPGGRRD